MSEKLISLAIDEINTADFEVWAQAVLAQTKNYDFEPTGGMHDGGQDGYVREVSSETDHFIQISKEKDTKGKIRKTIKKLAKTRAVARLTYVTSQTEAERDLLEAILKQELGVDVIIHDKRWLLVRTQLDQKIENLLYGYSKDLIAGFEKIQRASRKFDHSARLSIVTYLETHVRSLRGAENFQTLCLDTAIYTALEGTDPEKGNFRGKAEIEDFIREQYPTVIEKSDETLENRLEFLSSKDNDPRIRLHPVDKYALPFSVRNEFDEKNQQIAKSEDLFVSSINSRFNDEEIEEAERLRTAVISTVQHSVLETYRTQAMNFAASFRHREFDPDIKVFSIIQEYVSSLGLAKEEKDVCINLSSLIFRRICYSSNEEERDYLSYLMKYFTLHFAMNGDFAVNQYFSEMASQLKVYVGTDIIVRCLSETLVKEQSRGMTNSLKILQDAGVTLRVTRQTLNEVFTHISITNSMFKQDYEQWYKHAHLDDVKNCDRILIRSFFYAFLEPKNHAKQPKNWSEYLRNFGAAGWFDKSQGIEHDENVDEFGSYLLDKFRFEFVEIGEVLKSIDEKLAKKIADEIMEHRDKHSPGSQILARNDAEMALFINAEREVWGERVSPDLYGLRTWWMTEESAVLSALRRNKQHDDVVVHPQFFINHYVFDPKFIRANATQNYMLTPTLFGLRITDRVPPSEMRDFISGIGDLADLDEAAVRARIRSASNKLKKIRR